MAHVKGSWWPYVAAAVLIIGLTVTLWVSFNLVLIGLDRHREFIFDPIWQWQLGWGAVAFYVAWWVVFFTFDITPEGNPEERRNQWYNEIIDRKILTLPTFLEFNTIRREAHHAGPEEAIERLDEKGSKTIQTVSALLGFSLLIVMFSLNLVVIYQDTLSLFQERLTTLIMVLQVIAIVAFVIGLDSLDTSLNRFIDVDIHERYRISRYYYRTGIYYYYRGLVVLIFTALLAMMMVHPLVTTVGVFVFAILGYDYWFGYTGGYKSDIEGHSTERRGSVDASDSIDE